MCVTAFFVGIVVGVVVAAFAGLVWFLAEAGRDE